MSGGKLHTIIGTVICAATVLLFLAFYTQLPESIAVQITLDGTAGNMLPKPVFVFAFPLLFAIINVTKSVSLAKNENTAVYRYYIIPAIVVALSVVALVIGLNVK